MKRTQSGSFFLPPKKETVNLPVLGTPEIDTASSTPDVEAAFCAPETEVVSTLTISPSPSAISGLFLTSPSNQTHQFNVSHFHQELLAILKDIVISNSVRIEAAKRMKKVDPTFLSAARFQLVPMDFQTLLSSIDAKMTQYQDATNPKFHLKLEIESLRFLYLLNDKDLWLKLLKKSFSERESLLNCIENPSLMKKPRKKEKFKNFIYDLAQVDADTKLKFREIILAQNHQHELTKNALVNVDRTRMSLMNKIRELQHLKDVLTMELTSMYVTLSRTDKYYTERLSTLNLRLNSLVAGYPKDLEFDEAWLDINRSLFNNIRLMITSVRLTELLILESEVRRRSDVVVVKTKGDEFDHYVDFEMPITGREFSMQVSTGFGRGFFHGQYEHLLALNYVLQSIHDGPSYFNIFSIQ
jgi:hypothetical protein